MAVFGFFIITLSLPTRASYPPEPVFQVEKAKESVYFTFNILWENEPIEDILQILEANEITAVFFATGEWIKKYPDEALKIILSGHYLGNHSYSHRKLLFLPEEEVVAEIQGFNQVSMEELNYRPAFFRPPFGEYNPRMISLAGEYGCLTLLWSINTLMLSNYEGELIISRLEERLHDGAVILFHTSSPHIRENLPEIISYLKWKGYVIGSPGEIISLRGR